MFKSLKFLNEGFDRRYLKEEVEEELFHNDNGTDYVIVERSKSGKNALLRTQNGKKWIVSGNTELLSETKDNSMLFNEYVKSPFSSLTIANPSGITGLIGSKLFSSDSPSTLNVILHLSIISFIS